MCFVRTLGSTCVVSGRAAPVPERRRRDQVCARRAGPVDNPAQPSDRGPALSVGGQVGERTAPVMKGLLHAALAGMLGTRARLHPTRVHDGSHNGRCRNGDDHSGEDQGYEHERVTAHASLPRQSLGLARLGDLAGRRGSRRRRHRLATGRDGSSISDSMRIPRWDHRPDPCSSGHRTGVPGALTSEVRHPWRVATMARTYLP